MKINDFVVVEGKIGIIIEKYENPEFDWEVICLKGIFYTGCKQDCFTENQLKPYKWRDYPKTLTDKLRLLLKNT